MTDPVLIYFNSSMGNSLGLTMNDARSTENRIKEVALELFATKGFAGTGIREIAQGAKLTTASLYHYVRNKDELLFKMLEETIGGLLSGGLSIIRTVSRPEEQLACLVQFHVQAHAFKKRESAVLDVELRRLKTSAREQVFRLADSYEDIWRTVIEEGVASGIFNDVDPRDARLALINMCTGVNIWYSSTGKITPQEYGLRFTKLAFAKLNARRAGRPCRVETLELPDPSWITALALDPPPVMG